LIADEVMAGWGRTGKWFSVDHWGLKPDILVTAKGITSAYVPLGLCATTTTIANYFEDHYFSHGHTYEAHPLTLGPAVATIEEVQRLNLVERAAELEPYLREKLEALRARHVSVGDVRGLGLFFAVEIVKNRQTKQLFNTMRDKVEGRPDCREDDGAGGLHTSMGKPLCDCAPADCYQGRAGPGSHGAR
jgi:taurine--2-oxoglutarate transaminase